MEETKYEDINNLSNEIMDKITAEHITMRPRFYFILASVALSLILALTMLISLYVFSIIIFHLRNHNPLGFLQFGTTGLSPFIETFPIFPMIIGICIVILGYLLLIRYTQAYRFPTKLVVVSLILGVAIFGFTMDFLGLNEIAVQNPILQRVYAPFMGDDFAVGTVIEVNTSEDWMYIQTPSGDILKVDWGKQTQLPLGANFQVGQRIRVVGEIIDGEIQAIGISIGGLNWRNNFPTLEAPRYPSPYRPEVLHIQIY